MPEHERYQPFLIRITHRHNDTQHCFRGWIRAKSRKHAMDLSAKWLEAKAKETNCPRTPGSCESSAAYLSMSDLAIRPAEDIAVFNLHIREAENALLGTNAMPGNEEKEFIIRVCHNGCRAGHRACSWPVRAATKDEAWNIEADRLAAMQRQYDCSAHGCVANMDEAVPPKMPAPPWPGKEFSMEDYKHYILKPGSAALNELPQVLQKLELGMFRNEGMSPRDEARALKEQTAKEGSAPKR